MVIVAELEVTTCFELLLPDVLLLLDIIKRVLDSQIFLLSNCKYRYSVTYWIRKIEMLTKNGENELKQITTLAKKGFYLLKLSDKNGSNIVKKLVKM